MHKLTETEVNELQWGDANYFGYYWDTQFTDPTLVIRIAPANSPVQELICIWAVHFELNLDYKNKIVSLLTWKVSFDKLPNGTWKVYFDFASDGSIEFKCSSLALRDVVNKPV